MENTVSHVLVGTVVKNALKSIKVSPERGIRNLVDMALQFSGGRFQKNFFTIAQTMLQNENSAYYHLVRDVVTHTDIDRLYTFGMNLGYNGCTIGARHIRENEEKLGCNIPWSVVIQVDTTSFEEKQQKYLSIIQEGESLGIYVWMLFAKEEPEKTLSLAGEYPDSAFGIFCRADDLTDAFLDETAGLNNVMIIVQYDENTADICNVLQKKELLYSVWYPYGQKDTEMIINGDLFSCTEQCSPVFTILLPCAGCPDEIRKLAHQELQRIRSSQTYRTIAWELLEDTRQIDSVISGDSYFVCFDKNGNLCDRDLRSRDKKQNLFRHSLLDVLKNNFPKIKE